MRDYSVLAEPVRKVKRTYLLVLLLFDCIHIVYVSRKHYHCRIDADKIHNS